MSNLSQSILKATFPRFSTRTVFSMLYAKWMQSGRPDTLSILRTELSSRSGSMELGIAELASMGIIKERPGHADYFKFSMSATAIINAVGANLQVNQ